MASDGATAELELLDELLQDAVVDENDDSDVASTGFVAGIVSGDDDDDHEAMSAEDVLQQLDSVTLSLEVDEIEDHDAMGDTTEMESSAPIEAALAHAADDRTSHEDASSGLLESGHVDEEPEHVETVVASPHEVGDSASQEDTPASPLESGVVDEPEHVEAVVAVAVETEAEAAVLHEDDHAQCKESPTADSVNAIDDTDANEGRTNEFDLQVVIQAEVSSAEGHTHDNADVAVDGSHDGEVASLSPMDHAAANDDLGDLVSIDGLPLSAMDGATAAQTIEEKAVDTTLSRSEEEVAPQAPAPVLDTTHSVLPPPAPTAPLTQPLFSGSLNPAKVTEDTSDGTSGRGDDDDDDDSDSDDDAYEDVVPPPLPLDPAMGNDDDEELEVDAAVADEIRASKTINALAIVEPSKQEQLQPSFNALLDALGPVKSNDSKTNDDITMAFEDPIEVRTAQVVLPPVSPESSILAFGIGYQSLRKRTDRESEEGENTTFSIMKGPTFQELESEVTLDSGGSLSQRRVNSGPLDVEEDEFGTLLDSAASPTRVEAFLQKTRESIVARSPKEEEAALVEELRKATVHEKQHLHDTETPVALDIGSKPEGDNALTLKELHSMYKRGLGDQEVRLMDDDDDEANARSSVYDTAPPTAPVPPPLSVMGRLLSKPSLTTHVIAEEGEDDDEGDADGGSSAHHNRDESLNDEDVDAVAMNSERMTFDDHGSSAPRGDETSNDWKEIQLLHQTSMPSSSTQPQQQQYATAGDAANACSKISYAEALQYFLESDDVLVHRDRIVAEEKPPVASCFSCFARPRLTFSGAIDQRDRFFCVAATSFDPRNTVHVRMLQTIYRKLVGSGSRDVPLMGAHWETIGFQGADPSTDLRGCGVLSLLQMLYVVESHAEFARRFHSVSQHPVRHFPLACALINITLQCLVSLRNGALYRESNKRSSVFDAANALHVAIATQLTREIQSSSDEIPLVMKRVLENGRLHPDRVIEAHASSKSTAASSTAPPNHHQQPQQSSRKSSAAAGRASSSRAAGEFTEIGLHSVADD